MKTQSVAKPKFEEISGEWFIWRSDGSNQSVLMDRTVVSQPNSRLFYCQQPPPAKFRFPSALLSSPFPSISAPVRNLNLHFCVSISCLDRSHFIWNGRLVLPLLLRRRQRRLLDRVRSNHDACYSIGSSLAQGCASLLMYSFYETVWDWKKTGFCASMMFFLEINASCLFHFFYHQSYARALSYEFLCLDRIENNLFILLDF